MKKAKSVALIVAGKVTDSSLARFWSLSEMLGPVKASSYRLASRIANRLRAGHPVDDYAEFEACRTILISVPDQALPHAVVDLSASTISWNGKSVVLCNALLDSGDLQKLAARGASVGSIAVIPGFDDLRYLVEGDKLAVLQLKRLVEHRERRAIVIERHLKPFYLAALTCTGTLSFAVAMAASESLRHAGVRPADSAAILERQLVKSLRSYLRGGRRVFPAPRHLASQLTALSIVDPQLSNYIQQSCSLVARLMERPETPTPKSGRNGRQAMIVVASGGASNHAHDA
jgi:hypothetical protein